MTLTLTEGAIDAVITYLSANFPAKVAELNTRYADTIVLADVTSVGDAERVEIEAAAYPYVQVISPRTAIEAEVDAAAFHLTDIVAACYIMDDAGRSFVRRKGYRYGLAIFELLKQARKDAGLLGYTIRDISTIDYRPLAWTRETSRVLGAVFVLFQVFAAETFPD